METEAAEALAQRILADSRSASEALHIAVGPARLGLEPGERLRFAGGADVFEIVRIEDAEARRLELRRVRPTGASIVDSGEPSAPQQPAIAPTPAFSVLDLAPLPGSETDERPLAAVFASPWLGDHDVYAGASLTRRAIATAPAAMGELLWALWPGPVDRWDNGNRVRIKLYGGILASAARDDVLNGANVFAIQFGNEWEIIQAAICELVAENEYQLSDLLRGRLGSAHAMAAPHPVGARIVKLDHRLARVEIGAHERHETLRVVAPPSGALASSNRAAIADIVLPHAAVRPWAPAHLRARRQSGGDVAISWIRCARLGDGWGPGEPPIGARAEAYVVDIFDGSDVARSVNVAVPSFLYSIADQTADFGAPPASLHIRVAQIGESGAPGLKNELTITL